MQRSKTLAIILAGGEGSRMRSKRSKVLHEIGGLPIVLHVLKAAAAIGDADIAVVIGHSSEAVQNEVRAATDNVQFFLQKERLGTANAVAAVGIETIRSYDFILVLYGDTPLMRSETLINMRSCLANGSDIVVTGFQPTDPTGYGRLIERSGQLIKIVEEADANAAEKQIGYCNGGATGYRGAVLADLLPQIDNNNAKHEYYLTDAVELAAVKGKRATAIEIAAEEVVGVNTRVDLANVAGLWQQRKRTAAMLGGATLVSPETVFFSFDTELAEDVLVEQNVHFGTNVAVGEGSVVHANSYIEGAIIGANVHIGPFARLRPGTCISDNAKIGNFCEIKGADIAAGAKINHLSYIGDASVGENTNIGAGVITCNYDGAQKHRTTIGAKAFIGSNASLVAPVTIGEGAYVASGSVIVDEVGASDLAFGRARQVNKAGYAIRLRDRTRTS